MVESWSAPCEVGGIAAWEQGKLAPGDIGCYFSAEGGAFSFVTFFFFDLDLFSPFDAHLGKKKTTPSLSSRTCRHARLGLHQRCQRRRRRCSSSGSRRSRKSTPSSAPPRQERRGRRESGSGCGCRAPSALRAPQGQEARHQPRVRAKDARPEEAAVGRPAGGVRGFT